MELTIEQALQQGVAAHKEGKLQDAERLYRAILQSQPLHPDANHNLGVLAVSVNKAGAALPLFKTALEANPKIEKFWLSYIDALIKEKQFENSKLLIEQAKKQGVAEEKLNLLETKLTPTALANEPKLAVQNKSLSLSQQRKKLFKQKKRKKKATKQNLKTNNPSQQQLSNLLEYYQKGRFNDAEKLALSLTRRFPSHPFSWKLLGALLKQKGKISESVAPMQKAIKLAPEDAEAHSNLGATLQQMDKLDEAEKSHKRAIALNPNYSEAHNNLGTTLRKRGRLEEAEASYKKAMALKPDYADALYNLGNTLKELGRLEEAGASFKQAIALKPGLALAHNNLGIMYKELGRLEEAEASYAQAIALKPDYAEAHRHLTAMKQFKLRDQQYLAMQKIYLNKNITEEQRCHINFGLAKACQDLGDFEQAFSHYSEGNLIRKKLLNYDISQDVTLFDQIKCSHPNILEVALDSVNLKKTLTPIFIVGMPRSGTSLVEQIISSHSQITGAGELPFVSLFGKEIATGFIGGRDALLNFREKYLHRLEDASLGNLIVSDKMPQNFRFIGLISAAFPEAKIVHVKRNPAAVCWANFKQYFVSKNIGYCYGLEDIVNYHGLYGNLMEFWRSSLGERVYNLDYEVLVESQERETRHLIDYLGLDWDQKCLSPEENTRSVATASSSQVRTKVYQGSSQAWKKYESLLNGAFDELQV